MIGPGTRIKGELNGDDPVDFSGTFEGHSRINALCRLRETARVAGDVAAINIVVEGEVSGKMLAAEKIEIGATARVQANVRARFVAIAEGAFFDGELHMEGRNGPPTPQGFTEKRKG